MLLLVGDGGDIEQHAKCGHVYSLCGCCDVDLPLVCIVVCDYVMQAGTRWGHAGEMRQCGCC